MKTTKTSEPLSDAEIGKLRLSVEIASYRVGHKANPTVIAFDRLLAERAADKAEVERLREACSGALTVILRAPPNYYDYYYQEKPHHWDNAVKHKADLRASLEAAADAAGGDDAEPS